MSDRHVFFSAWSQLTTSANTPPALPSDPYQERRNLRALNMPSRGLRIRWAPNEAFMTFQVQEWGFPFRCVWCWQAFQVAPRGSTLTEQTDRGGAIWLPQRNALYQPSIPYLPLWIGLTANILIYTTLIYSVLVARHKLLSAIRARRNLCPNCKYDLHATPPASPCPECGRTRTS